MVGTVPRLRRTSERASGKGTCGVRDGPGLRREAIDLCRRIDGGWDGDGIRCVDSGETEVEGFGTPPE